MIQEFICRALLHSRLVVALKKKPQNKSPNNYFSLAIKIRAEVDSWNVVRGKG